MNALIVLSALLAAASAAYVGDHYGGLPGYVGGHGLAAPLGYGGYGAYGGPGAYGGYGGYGGYAAPVVKTIAHAPVATSYQNSYQVSKAAIPVHYAAPAVVKAPIAYAAGPAYGLGLGGLGHDLGYGAGYGHGLGYGQGYGLGYGQGYGLGYGHL